MNFLEQVYAKRKKLADVLGDEEYSGIREIVEELYPDKAHFVYELLQNAEDTGATLVKFILHEDMLVFEHNGRAFQENDVWGITNIGKGTKKDDEETIGKFGIGFKAVFAYTETPRIWSPTFTFEISELVLPKELPPNPDFGKTTHFEFPFNNPKKSEEDACDEVREALKELSETTLLFLTHIESILWELPDKTQGQVLRIHHSANHIEILKQEGGKSTASSHFLRFTGQVEGLSKQCIAVAYALELLLDSKKTEKIKKFSDQFKIVPALPGRVAVFFPAEKETSGLRFHLHAPFVPELSRASIKETPVNSPLLKQLATLTASSLHEIRDLGLLTAEFLAVLPNPQDTLPMRYQCIREAIITAMNEESLTPTHLKSHAPAKHLLQAKATLKSLLTIEDLEFLCDYEEVPPNWAVGATQKNSRIDQFLSCLEITDWDLSSFVHALRTHLSSRKRLNYETHQWVNLPDDAYLNWLSKKSDSWHQKFYALLQQELDVHDRLPLTGV